MKMDIHKSFEAVKSGTKAVIIEAYARELLSVPTTQRIINVLRLNGA